ncbi:hypothetical protein SAMN05216480_10390 [Pustulibacterium marinum]|uniref:Regulatory protein, luxR family n=1 Tax=Pustulibacterium marinum TaxID=1224947 RepID=A0A1I7G2E1_9FLAO|nr:hypothetical protein [Pustulibacterium marinum]SFU42597.1 hypothetical protein SAMN05216480_10390 [Pustulibacterium marinum]
MKTNNLYILYVLIIFPYILFSQDLKEKVRENGLLFYKNMDSAYTQVDTLIQQAQSQNEPLLELLLLDRKCHYFYNKTDIDNLLTSSKILRNKAIKYKKPSYESSALLYLAESYSLNELPDKALHNLNEAENIIAKDTTLRAFFIKSNILISQSNIYYDKKEYKKALAKHQQLIKTGNFLKDQSQYNHFQYINYSNLANVYLNENIDSAAYYVKKSIELSTKAVSEKNIKGANLFILGKVAEKRNDTSNAIKNYLESYHILKNTGDALNRSQLLESLQSIYASLGKTDSAKIFQQELDDYNVNTLQNKYKALKKIVKEDTSKKNKSSQTLYIILGISIVVLLSSITFILIKKRKKLPVEPEETEQEKLANNYDSLIEMIKKDDPAFLSHFENIYPDFRNKLLELNPELTISEIKFCALLKLNIPTKQIAQYTFIETRTVQNKKHRIRKKLNIPKNTDTYNWFNEI